MKIEEDKVRNDAHVILGFSEEEEDVKQGTGQITTFNALGIKGFNDKPDGWYIPHNKMFPAIILEAKNSDESVLNPKHISELKKNCKILLDNGYKKVVGILHNGVDTKCFFNNEEVNWSPSLEHKNYYINQANSKPIDKEKIYQLTAKINNCLNKDFGIKNLYHRMIFTACTLVAKRFGAELGRLSYAQFKDAVIETLDRKLYSEKYRNPKIELLVKIFKDEIKMNQNMDSQTSRDLLEKFTEWVNEISDSLYSSNWNGEDVMGIFFNEFNRYKKKTEKGQVFTPDHITNFMYHLIGCSKDDYILDATCGSGAFLAKAMSNMINEAGGPDTQKAEEIKQNQLFGIEFDREIFALACANMLIHKDGKTNLAHMDTRTEEACKWMREKPINKVLMNPPFEKPYGCMEIVENVLDSVNPRAKCAFILPDKKLEKTSKKQIERILSHHRLTHIIKLPEPLFFGVGITTSIFVFETGIPQNNEEIFGCYIENDGLETVKNKGRHDVKNKWKDIEAYWLDSIKRCRDLKYNTAQWINPNKYLSYQMPEKPFEISEEDFKKTAFDYICFKKGIDTKEFGEKLLDATLYGSEVSTDDTGVNIKIG